MIDLFNHWDDIYKSKDHKKTSWYQQHSTISYDWILDIATQDDAIIDVGCGVSVLTDNLLEKGYTDISLLELSTSALNTTKSRLKKHSNKLTFYNKNILDFNTGKKFKFWHDRAVFHFLTNNKDQQIYIEKLYKHLNNNGFFLLSTFSPDGPKECSDLNIVQYDVNKITKLLGDKFKLIKSTFEMHQHPNGSKQNFNYFLLKKV